MTGFKYDSDGAWIEKDPNAVLDYTVDWGAEGQSWLNGDTIASVVWTLDAGVTKDSQSNTTTTATAWISGGVAGVTYSVACRITTAGGRSDERTFRLKVKQR